MHIPGANLSLFLGVPVLSAVDADDYRFIPASGQCSSGKLLN
jgi:hypothetical protein